MFSRSKASDANIVIIAILVHFDKTLFTCQMCENSSGNLFLQVFTRRNEGQYICDKMKKASVYCKNLDMFVRSEDLFAFFFSARLRLCHSSDFFLSGKVVVLTL